MKKLMPYALCLMPLLAACGSEKPVATEKIQCGDYAATIEVYQDKLVATINGEKITLPQVVSASGAKYEGSVAGHTGGLWNKGQDWSLFIGEEVFIECASVE